ncbi:hypothetical protein [Streptomyces sp. NPDC008125]|uniref:hypothetical protein n=1 Tax=Streptomyces sp. NPDC008125 TaxID=3364811 RepID=UPI0036EC9F37
MAQLTCTTSPALPPRPRWRARAWRRAKIIGWRMVMGAAYTAGGLLLGWLLWLLKWAVTALM